LPTNLRSLHTLHTNSVLKHKNVHLFMVFSRRTIWIKTSQWCISRAVFQLICCNRTLYEIRNN